MLNDKFMFYLFKHKNTNFDIGGSRNDIMNENEYDNK